eukprot:12820661-Prorocentrum_lima.AAC.1
MYVEATQEGKGSPPPKAQMPSGGCATSPVLQPGRFTPQIAKQSARARLVHLHCDGLWVFRSFR